MPTSQSHWLSAAERPIPLIREHVTVLWSVQPEQARGFRLSTVRSCRGSSLRAAISRRRLLSSLAMLLVLLTTLLVRALATPPALRPRTQAFRIRSVATLMPSGPFAYSLRISSVRKTPNMRIETSQQTRSTSRMRRRLAPAKAHNFTTHPMGTRSNLVPTKILHS